jgi:ParB/RepB/Spo0J family partition protein
MAIKIPLDKIFPDASQPRKKFDETALEELAGSIEQNGLIQPITVRRAGRGYVVIAGERRWRAHRLLRGRGLARFASIECHVRKGVAGADTRIKQIAENLNRENLEPMEEARAFASLVEEFGLTAAEIAAKLGLAPFRVEWRLSLLNLSPPIARMVETGQIDRQLALEAARLPHHADQTRLVQMVNRGDLVGWKAQRNAVDAILGNVSTLDLFGEEAPKPNAEDVATLTRMEDKIERVAAMVAQGWRAGECVVANKVDPDRSLLMADKISGIRSALAHMERELRNLGAQAKIVLAR